ncbi:MAG: Glu-tRNA(Gln) amidotransferase subunit GatE [archaeon]|nr:MAG: Glu-tRNA(Gln) amidotransferase subunit GatE [archaeon]
MTGQNYEKLGFKAGIEIHQQLETHKLFCNCQARITDEDPMRLIERHLRPVAGETGEVDRAALFESLKRKGFVYHGYDRESCLVESDDEPPHDVNREAFRTAMQVIRMLNCNVPDEVHFMRKTVIDGSNTSGFQRTAIVGMNGFLDTSSGRVGVTNVSLEEEAAKIIKREEDKVEYGLDRLGIPLVEIGTAPDIKSPAQAREVAEKIGMLLRATGSVKRGIGTIRQDVNVSIEGGARIEIKGMQDLKLIQKTVEAEVERQLSLLKIRDELAERQARIDKEILDVTLLFENTKNSMISELLSQGKTVFAFKLKGFAGLLRRNLYLEKTFGKELSEYAKSYGIKGFIHSDEDLGKYNLTREFLKLKKNFNCTEKDVIGIVSEEEERARKACLAILDRAEKATHGIPEETRVANTDLTTSYLRPLPGGARMYPETDVKPISVTEDLLKIELPETLEERKEKFIRLGLSGDLARQMVKSRYLGLFEELAEEKIDHARVADVLLNTLKDLKRKGNPVDRIGRSELKEVLKKLDKIPKESTTGVLEKLSRGKSLKESVDSVEFISIEELDSIIENELDKELIKKEGKSAFKKLMGPVMARVRGKIDGNIVAERLRKKIEELT